MDEYKRRRRRSRAVMSMFLDSLGGIIDDVDVATFDSDGSDLKALIVGIEPVQSGTGDPSPDNVRPITGHSSVNVIVSPTLNPLDGTITNIPLGGTYYGGTLDVLTGLLTVTKAFVNLNTLTWESIGLGSGITGLISESLASVIMPIASNNVVQDMLCSIFKTRSTNAIYSFDYAISENVNNRIVLRNGNDTTPPDAQLCYPLATPTTIQLSGQQISTFLGTNHVWCDSGKIIHLEY